MQPEPLPKNVLFLQGAHREYEALKSAPDDFAAVHGAFVSLGKDGAPRDAALVPVAEPPFPITLAYRFKAGRFTIVFESNTRVVLQTSKGARIVRSVLPPAGATFTIWAILEDGPSA